MEDLDLMVDEVRQAGREGVGCLVDGGHADMGRSVPFLKQLSEKSGMPINIPVIDQACRGRRVREGRDQVRAHAACRRRQGRHAAEGPRRQSSAVSRVRATSEMSMSELGTDCWSEEVRDAPPCSR
jgi:hypothetical protein